MKNTACTHPLMGHQLQPSSATFPLTAIFSFLHFASSKIVCRHSCSLLLQQQFWRARSSFQLQIAPSLNYLHRGTNLPLLGMIRASRKGRHNKIQRSSSRENNNEAGKCCFTSFFAAQATEHGDAELALKRIEARTL